MNIKKNIEGLDRKLLNVIKAIGRIADKRDVRVCLVGGFVRDVFLKKDNFDVDIILERDGIKFANLVSKALNLRATCYHRFGTATISNKYTKIDIATFRKERYPYPGSLPVVSRGSLIDDLARRDFTINALAVSINKKDFGYVFDYFNGLADLKKGKLRVLHMKSFLDDPTRILRLGRFKSRFDFSLSPKTRRCIREAKMMKALEKMQVQRIRDELILIFKEQKPQKTISWLADVYGLAFIHKGLYFKANDTKKFTKVRSSCLWFQRLFPDRRKLDSWLMYLIVLLSRLSTQELRQFVKSFAFSRGEAMRLLSYRKSFKTYAKLLAKGALPPSYVYKILNPLSYEVILLLFSTLEDKRAKKYIRNFLKFYNLLRIKLGGDDLVRLGIKPGPNFTTLLGKVKDGKLNLGLSSKREELAFLKKLIKK